MAPGARCGSAPPADRTTNRTRALRRAPGAALGRIDPDEGLVPRALVGRYGLVMERAALRSLIKAKLVVGGLPQDSLPRVWGLRGDGETCDACGTIVATHQHSIEGLAIGDGKRRLRFHVECYSLWDGLRRTP